MRDFRAAVSANTISGERGHAPLPRYFSCMRHDEGFRTSPHSPGSAQPFSSYVACKFGWGDVDASWWVAVAGRWHAVYPGRTNAVSVGENYYTPTDSDTALFGNVCPCELPLPFSAPSPRLHSRRLMGKSHRSTALFWHLTISDPLAVPPRRSRKFLPIFCDFLHPISSKQRRQDNKH